MPKRSVRHHLAAGAAVTRAAVLPLTHLLAVAATAAAVCEPADPVSSYALEGDAAPPTGAVFQTFDRANIVEALGAVAIAFGGDTDGPSTEDDVVYGIGMKLIAQEGAAAPGTEGTFGVFEPFETAHQLSAAGDVAFITTLRGVPSDTDRAIYRNGDLVAREGAAAAGIPDRVYQDFGFVGVGDAGEVGFLAKLDGPGADDSVVMLDGVPIYRQGEAVPGLPDETWDADFVEAQWNGHGDLLLVGNTSLPSSMDVVVLRRLVVDDRGIDEQIVAQEGQHVPARDGDDFLEQILQLALAENGAWALRGNLELAPATSNAVILTSDGLLVQEGDAVTDMPGALIGNIAGIDMNTHGDVVYLADLEGERPPDVDEGIFANGCLLVTDGEQVPGLPAGTFFSDLGFEDVYVSDDRVVVFAAGYTGVVSGDGLFTQPLGQTCRADIDGSGRVGFGDLLAVLTAWGDCPEKGACPADVSNDRQVNDADLLAVLSAWGPCL